MKQIKFLSMLLIALTMCINFTSCSDEPDTWPDNPAKAIAGTYVGDGKISYLDVYDVETWRGMKIDVNRSSNEYVTLTLRFATGETILSADRAYQVIETKTGYILKDADATNVVIEITKKGEMYYKNPNISVSGENGYVITFNGKRE
ncbi:MAG: hypothetical protein II260_05465 [Muribaculaceae bacterium]|nr:hypothetical protein [Muribaculaceae bacterium]